MHRQRFYRGGFALPTVLIASVVMFTILAVSVSSVVAVRTALKTQYYEQLAKAAGEAGVAYAKACLAKNGNVPLWSDNKPLRPSTDCAGNELLTPNVQVLVVAGGGGGGEGGGGGGGVVYDEAVSISAQSYPVSVGYGGSGSPDGVAAGSNGQNSSAFGLVAIGGGVGGVAATPIHNGADGGSGGGGRRDGGGVGGTGVAGQGNNGGSTPYQAGVLWKGAAGGGGAGSAGLPGSGNNVPANETGGNGGNGLTFDISGALVTYGGGGGGGVEGSGGTASQRGIGGTGGGGSGSSNQGGTFNAQDGQNGVGGGGGGRSRYSATGPAGDGGNGVVVIRYPRANITATGGNQVYDSGPYRIHRFANSGTFQVTNASIGSCPSDPRCSVVVNDTLRSSFTVGMPTLDAEGKAVTLPNTGYVELLRESTGTVWRTYRQPSVQAAVVPDFCSGETSSSLGWSNAVVTSDQNSLPGAPAAESISVADSSIVAGSTFYRKDFVVTQDGSYTVQALSGGAQDDLDIYVDGEYVLNSKGAVATASKSLSVGCHSITARLTNETLYPRVSKFSASIQREGANPIVVSDSSWRASAGQVVHYSSPSFYADPNVWGEVVDYANSPTAQQANASWQNLSGDPFTRMISPNRDGCPSSCPPSSRSYIRDNKSIYVASNTEVIVSALCDDDCTVYVDGEPVIGNALWANINQQTMTLTAGWHHVGAKLWNGNAAVNPSAMAITVRERWTGQILTRTDDRWLGTGWSNAPFQELYSYEAEYLPDLAVIPQAPPSADLLLVGGGGGGGSNSGGGGGGGGVLYMPGTQLGTGTYTVTVGGGGAGGTNSGSTTAARGQNGGDTTFGSYTAIGGGGGASRDNGPGPSSGGSGGGGAGTTSSGASVRDIGANGVGGQGYRGGNGTPSDQSVEAKGGGGGGASGAGVSATNILAGNGGAGFITYVTGSILSFAGGGGGGNTAGNGYLGGAPDGGGQGSSAPAEANRGGGGAGVGGGAGGSGTVIVRIKTGSMTVSTTGSPTITNVTIAGVDYTVYRFNSNGSFTISEIN